MRFGAGTPLALVVGLVVLGGGTRIALAATLPTTDPSSSAPSLDLGQVVESVGRWLVGALHGDAERASADHPRWNANDSPRATVLTFLENVEYLREGRSAAWPRVRSTLPLRDDLATEARAFDLARVFDRIGEVPAHRLATAAEIEDDGATRYRLFPGAIDARDVWRQLEGAPDGRIVLARAEDGTWRFSANTLENVGAMLASMSSIPPRVGSTPGAAALPSLLDTSVPPDRRVDEALVLVSLAATLLATLFVRWGAQRIAARISDDHAPLERMLRRLAAPAALLVLISGLVFASTTIALHPAVSGLRWKITGLSFVLALAFLLHRALPVLADRIGAHAHDHHLTGTLIPLLVRFAQVLLGVIAAAIVLESVFGIDVTGLVAGVGIFGLALGLAAQESMRNWFGALTIYFARPFTQGDWILYEGDYALVRRIGLNATDLRLASGESLTVPNMRFIDREVRNTTERPYLRREIHLSIPYDSTPERMDLALETIRAALAEDEVTEGGAFDELDREPHVTFSDFESDHLFVRVYYWFRIPEGESGWYDFLDHCDVVNRALLRRFSEAGIALAFPTRSVRLGEDERRHADTPDDEVDGDDE